MKRIAAALLALIITLCLPCAAVHAETGTLLTVTIPFSVSFDANGHGTAPAALSVPSGEMAAKPADPSEEGYTFGGWYTGSGCADADKYDFNTPVTENIMLYAKWTKNGGTTPGGGETHGGGTSHPGRSNPATGIYL